MATRNYNIDFLRFVLVLFVIQWHMNPYSGTIAFYSVFNVHLVVWMFMLISLYLLQNRGATYGKVKWIRLILPYLSWSAIYLGMRSFKGVLQGSGISLDAWTLKAFLTGGAAVHLYFIPLLLFYQLIACALYSLFLTRSEKSTQIINCAILIAALVISSIFEVKSTVIGSEHGLFVDAIFAVICAQALVSLDPNASSNSPKLFNAAMVFFAVALLWWQANIDGQVLLKVMIAASILYIILRMPVLSKLSRLNWLFTGSFGIFLMHHAIIELAEVLCTKLEMDFLPYDLTERILVTFIVVTISCGLIYLIRRSKCLSLLLIGEKRT